MGTVAIVRVEHSSPALSPLFAPFFPPSIWKILWHLLSSQAPSLPQEVFLMELTPLWLTQKVLVSNDPCLRSHTKSPLGTLGDT